MADYWTEIKSSRSDNMQSSVELRKSPQTLVEESLGLNLQLVRPTERRWAPVSFRRFIVLCEVLADLITITVGVTLGCVIYDSLGLGKHIYYPLRVVTAVAFPVCGHSGLDVGPSGSISQRK